VQEPVAPQLEFVTRVVAEIAAPIASGRGPRGRRQLIPITGGTLRGPRLSGRVLSGGADFQLIHADGVVELEARYFVETDEGERAYVCNQGIAHAAEGALYFRTLPRFETGSERLRWLTTSIFVASARPLEGRVELDFFRVC
jgi:hypothetical protein